MSINSLHPSELEKSPFLVTTETARTRLFIYAAVAPVNTSD
ncbi:MAG: hypothetical protein WB706_13550 [Nitrososphaeraceae archaeon]